MSATPHVDFPDMPAETHPCIKPHVEPCSSRKRLLSQKLLTVGCSGTGGGAGAPPGAEPGGPSTVRSFISSPVFCIENIQILEYHTVTGVAREGIPDQIVTLVALVALHQNSPLKMM